MIYSINMKFKIDDRVVVKDDFYRKHKKQIGKIVEFNCINGNPYILFDNKELNDNLLREDGACCYSEKYVKLYTMDQTKRNLLDEI